MRAIRLKIFSHCSGVRSTRVAQLPCWWQNVHWRSNSSRIVSFGIAARASANHRFEGSCAMRS